VLYLSHAAQSYSVGLLRSYGYATSRQCCTYLMQLRAIVLGCYVAMAMPLGSVVPISCSSELWSHQTVHNAKNIFLTMLVGLLPFSEQRMFFNHILQ